MKYIETPVTVRTGLAYSHIEDADGSALALASVIERYTPDGRHYDANERRVQELVQVVNAYDVLVDAVEKALEMAEYMHETWGTLYGGFFELAETLRAALALAEGKEAADAIHS